MEEKIDVMQRYFEENYNNDCGYTLFNNILWHIAESGCNKTQALALLDGIGFTKNEKEFIVKKLIGGQK